MPKFIRVHPKYPTTDDITYYINVDKIELVLQQNEFGCIVTNGQYDNFSQYEVKETVEEIMEMING